MRWPETKGWKFDSKQIKTIINLPTLQAHPDYPEQIAGVSNNLRKQDFSIQWICISGSIRTSNPRSSRRKQTNKRTSKLEVYGEALLPIYPYT